MESSISRADEHSNGVVILGSHGENKENYQELNLDKPPEIGDLAVQDTLRRNSACRQQTASFSKSVAENMESIEFRNSKCGNGPEDLSGNNWCSTGNSTNHLVANLSNLTGDSVTLSSKPCGSSSAPVSKDKCLFHSFIASKSGLSALEKKSLWSSSSSSSLPGLGRSQTAPSRSHCCNDQLDENPNMNLGRAKTGKRENQKHDLKVPCMQLDKLSEREKKRIIENLAKIQKDGTVEVDVARSAPVASELFELDVCDTRQDNQVEEGEEQCKQIPKLNIAMLIVGTRGDVQPFVAVAKRLQEYGHRVRLATHANFHSFVTSAGIEFYPLGGDPRALAEYMARNKGFLPSGPSEISFQRRQLKAIVNSLLPACIEPDADSGLPFRAQAIIANPPAYGHVHVAEALNVPLHIFFTMPWTPTNEFPHPLTRVMQSAGYWLSYVVVDILIWWGIRSIINEFRKKKLKLPPIAYLSAYYGSISHLPTGYLWSPHLVPKPKDWGNLVDVVGFCFLNLGSNYSPQQKFLQWLQAGPKPVYVGFGSMPLEDSSKTTNIILEALERTGQRGIIDKGWGNLGNFREIPDYVFLVEDCPHDWLFLRCTAVVHHGGAGTTAAGLRAGCPTTIVPFFGDQLFWADRVHAKGVGPPPIPIGQLTTEALADAIRTMLDPQVKLKAIELGKQIQEEDGVVSAVNVFHKHLPRELPKPEAPPEPPSFFQCLLLTLERWFCLPCIT